MLVPLCLFRDTTFFVLAPCHKSFVNFVLFFQIIPVGRPLVFWPDPANLKACKVNFIFNHLWQQVKLCNFIKFVLPKSCLLVFGVLIKMKKLANVTCNIINTITAGVRIYCSLKLGEKQGYFGWLTNRIASQLIVLESCSNPQKTWQVFKSAIKKIFCVSFFCEWHK